jgi:IS5 family transposase
MLRIHFMQQWFSLSDPAMEEALHDTPIYREFAGLDNGMSRIPDETTILRFRRLLEEHQLADQMLAAVNATLVQAGLLLKAGRLLMPP